jgi:hypothetical protein
MRSDAQMINSKKLFLELESIGIYFHSNSNI